MAWTSETNLPQLVACARDGDRRAVDAVVAAARPYIVSVARRYSNDRRHIDDVAQDVSILLVRELPRLQCPQAVLGWLRLVTQRTVTRYGMRAAREDGWTLEPTSVSDDVETDAVEAVLRPCKLAALRRAVERLPIAERQLVEALFCDDRPDYRTIANRLGRPVGAIGPSRQRVLQRLRLDPAIMAIA